jgi:hypothetical protein
LRRLKIESVLLGNQSLQFTCELGIRYMKLWKSPDAQAVQLRTPKTCACGKALTFPQIH